PKFLPTRKPSLPTLKLWCEPALPEKPPPTGCRPNCCAACTILVRKLEQAPSLPLLSLSSFPWSNPGKLPLPWERKSSPPCSTPAAPPRRSSPPKGWALRSAMRPSKQRPATSSPKIPATSPSSNPATKASSNSLLARSCASPRARPIPNPLTTSSASSSPDSSQGQQHTRRTKSVVFWVRDRAGFLVCLLTLLMYFVMPVAIGETAYFVARKAEVAPIAIPVHVVILDAKYHRCGITGMQHTVNVILFQNVIGHDCGVPTNRFVWVGRNSRDYDYFLTRLVYQTADTEISEPLIGILHGGRSNKYFSSHASPHGRGFSIVHPMDIDPHPFVRNNVNILRWKIVELPHVRSLINLKMFAGIIDAFSGQVSLPEGQSSINEQQGRRDFRPEKYFLAMGCAV